MSRIVATPLVLVYVLAAAIALGLAGYAWRRRSKPSSAPFVGLMVALALWATVDGVNAMVQHPPSHGYRRALEWGMGSLVPVFWLAFALAYTGREEFVSPGVLAGLSVLPGATVAVVLAGDPGNLLAVGGCGTRVVGGVGVVAEPCPAGPWFYVHVTYAYTLVVIGMALLFRTVVAHESVYARQAAAILAGALVPLAGSVAWALGVVPVPGFDPTTALFPVAGLAFGHAILRRRFLEVMPATRRIGERAAIGDLKDGVVILDDDGRILRVNDAAGAAFGVDPGAVVGEDLSAAVGDADLAVEPGEVTAEVETDEGVREFEVTVSPVYDQRDQLVGHTLVFRDVTERVQRKQQLEALNRVLRHNLRNDMNVVQGYADTLSERTTDPEAEMAEHIAEQSSELVEVGTKVRDMERIMDRQRGEHRRFDFNGLLRGVVEEVREGYPGGRVILHLPRELHLTSDELVVETVLTNVVRNALEHNDSETPHVEVTAGAGGPSDGWVEVEVADNGPGIPEQDRVAIREGRETDLRHASGLGLWVVNWGVTKLGGEVVFDEREERGTAVRIRFPGRTPPPESDAETEAPDLGLEAD